MKSNTPPGRRPAPPTDTAPTNAAPRRAFSRTRAAAVLAAALPLLLLAALLLPPQWRQAQRREAYLPQLEAQAARTPDDGPLLALVGAGRMAAGENRAAADALRQAVAAGESNDDVWAALAANAAASGDRTLALADLRLGLKASPDSLALQGALARARAEGPDAPAPALAAAIAPQGPAPLRARYAPQTWLDGPAAWWGRLRPASSGYATRQAWARDRPADAQAQRLWGEALLRDRRPAEAVPVLALARSQAPGSPAVNIALADAYAQSGAAPQAALQYLACLKLRPNWPAALCGYGAAALQNGQIQNSVAAFTRATVVAPRDADAWAGLGQAQLKTGVAFVPAVDAFRAAAGLAPGRTDFLDAYADALRRAGRSPEAEGLVRRRLSADPDDALAHYLLGLILRDTDPTAARAAEAEAQTRESLRLSPHNPLASAQLGQILLDAGRTNEAVALFEDARARTPNDPKLLLVLARAYRRQGKAGPSASASARARAILADQDRADVAAAGARADPRNIGLHLKLAALYARLGRPDKAREEEDAARLLRADPAGTARRMDDFGASLQAALSGR